jgi:hypothetical protein
LRYRAASWPRSGVLELVQRLDVRDGGDGAVGRRLAPGTLAAIRRDARRARRATPYARAEPQNADASGN